MNRKNTALVLLSALVVALLLAACGTSKSSDESNSRAGQVTRTQSTTPTPAETAMGTYQSLTIDEFADIVENRADEYLIINVHIPYAGEVANTDANIPYNDLDALMAAIPDKNASVILYCRSGNMSKQAARALLDQGYTHLWDVPGGMSAWQSSGRTLIDG